VSLITQYIWSILYLLNLPDIQTMASYVLSRDRTSPLPLI